jgi:hypothetical protein
VTNEMRNLHLLFLFLSMVIKNKLDVTFGPVGTSTGLFLFLGGVVATYFSPIGLALIIIGVFIWLTSTSTFIDIEKKRVKFSNNLFGIIPVGKWIEINPGMKLGLKKVHRGYRAYTRGTQPADIHLIDIRIVLYSPDNKEIFTLKKSDSYETAKMELSDLKSILHLETI